MNVSRKLLAILALGVSIPWSGSLQAETYYLQNNCAFGHSWNTVLDGSGNPYWKTAAGVASTTGAVAGNDYYVGAGRNLRTPDNMDPTVNAVFPGDSLHLGYLDGTTTQSGTMGMKGSCTIPNLVFYSGIISLSTNVNFVLSGGITVDGTNCTISTSEKNDSRSFTINSKISGGASGVLNLQTVNAGSKLWVTNAQSDFAGTVNLKANSKIYLYSDSAKGRLGSDAVKLITSTNSQLYVNENQTFGSWTSNYYNANGVKAQLMPSSITVSDARTQEALAIAGITAPIGTVITSTVSARNADTYYLNQQVYEAAGSWETAQCWSTGSATGTKSGYVPTVGDTAHIATTMRTSTAQDVGDVTLNFLAKLYVDPNGTLALKNTNCTVNVPDLILNGGIIANGKASGVTNLLDGHITVESDSYFKADSDRSIRVLADISGTANLRVTTESFVAAPCKQATVILAADNSNFSGSFNLDRYTWLETTVDHALGTKGFTMAGQNNATIGGAQSVETVSITNSAAAGLSNTVTITGSLAAQTLNVTGKTTAFAGTGTLAVGAMNLDPGSTYTANDFAGTITFANGFTADSLKLKSVGVTVTGGDVVIGKSDLSTSLWVPTVGQIYSTTGYYKVSLDLSGADSSTIQVNHFEICTTTSGPNAMPVSEVKLAPVSTVRANTLSMASSSSTGLGVGAKTSTLTLGATSTTLAVDEIYVGGGAFYQENGTKTDGGKGGAALKAISGGKVTLTGTDGTSGADLYVGYCAVSTGGGAIGTVDLTGISADSVLKFDEVVIADKHSGAAYATGTFTMNSGLVEMNSLTLAKVRGTTGSSPNAATANFNLKGGTLKVANVQKGSNTGKEVINFNFTDGTLDVTNWGTEAANLDLVQNGGTLTTSSDVLAIHGDYTQNSGKLALDLGQKLVVTGDLTLGKIELDAADGFIFDSQMLYELVDLNAGATLNLNSVQLSSVGNLAGVDLSSMTLNNILYVGSQGLISNSVPEPSTWAILCLGVLGLGFLRRKHGKK